jgi:hypothetical protein
VLSKSKGLHFLRVKTHLLSIPTPRQGWDLQPAM